MTRTFLILAAAAYLFPAGAMAQTPSPSPTPESEYVFQFNQGLSVHMLDSMVFTNTEPLDLGSCTTTLLSDGPIACARNCDDVPACFLVFSGPPGWSTSDVLEKLDEEQAAASGAIGVVDALNSPRAGS